AGPAGGVAAGPAGGVAVAPAGAWVLLAALVLGLALPFAEHGLYFVNVRFQLLAGVLLSVAFAPSFRSWRQARGAALLLGAALALRLGLMLFAWSRTGPYLADVRALLARVPPAARLAELDAVQPAPSLSPWLPGLSPWLIDGTWPADYHFPVYLAARSGRFLPTLFDAPGQQPLRASGEEAAAEQAQRVLTRAFGGGDPRGSIAAALGHFDAILVAGLWRHPPATYFAGRLRLVEARPGIALYAVVPPPVPPTGARRLSPRPPLR
ncbi:MAG: hypothetical protein KGK10_03835, partial [Rhodospirillales bacterium]|nr:hypothetical protein [Rhodospirillales bacterium]